jgi:methylaspartate ammonia-lyase
MKIKNVLAVKGFGGFFWDDQAAIKKGAKRNGFTYFGNPVTPGFYAMRQSSEAVSILLILDDGHISIGDCCSVQYSARSGRDPIFRSDVYQPFIEENIIPLLIDKKITQFREMAEKIDAIKIDDKSLHTGIRYGVTQALLDAVAHDQGLTMAEIIAEEYGTEIAEEPVPIFSQTGDSWYEGVDRAILRRSQVFPHALINSLERFDKLQNYIVWTRNRIQELSDNDYRPYLHYDVYATLGMKYDNQIPKIVEHLQIWEDTAKPYNLIVEEPFDMGSKEGNIEMTQKLIEAKRDAEVNVIICADEWCNTLEDIKDFVDNKAAEMIQIKNPDLGGVNNIVEAVLYCQKNGVLPYLGGSCCETDVAAKVTWHIALATQPFETLAKPGMGVDESYQAGMNEMNRTLALIKHRRKHQRRG